MSEMGSPFSKCDENVENTENHLVSSSPKISNSASVVVVAGTGFAESANKFSGSETPPVIDMSSSDVADLTLTHSSIATQACGVFWKCFIFKRTID